ncbi:MAG: 2OG-Fe(II) oxygenase [Kiloniellales bacterium]
MKISARPIGWGEPAPWFEGRTLINPQFAFSSLGGRFVALSFFGRGSEPAARRFLEALVASRLARDDARYVSFGVSLDEADLNDELTQRAFPPQRIFHDAEGRIAASYGLLSSDETSGKLSYRPLWFILDPMLRVLASGTLDQAQAFVATLRALPRPDDHAGQVGQLWAPVLLTPRVLLPELCRALIEVYRQGEPQVSGFMRTEGGKTVGKLDPSFKRRADVVIEDESLRAALRDAIRLRLLPEIQKAFQFKVTRIERYIVACYGGEDGGFFRAHRDNTTAGTAHRRFAVTINLNAEDYDGGELWFPEYGTRRYKPPTGAAIVFSCSLLHEATPVTRGLRYATLPFLYDEEAARIREANNQFLGDGVGAYRE